MLREEKSRSWLKRSALSFSYRVHFSMRWNSSSMAPELQRIQMRASLTKGRIRQRNYWLLNRRFRQRILHRQYFNHGRNFCHKLKKYIREYIYFQFMKGISKRNKCRMGTIAQVVNTACQFTIVKPILPNVLPLHSLFYSNPGFATSSFGQCNI